MIDRAISILSRIRVADATNLIFIRDTELKHVIGITDIERRFINSEIDHRFAQLNRQAVGPQKGRW